MPWANTPEGRAKKAAAGARYRAAHPDYLRDYYQRNRERISEIRRSDQGRAKRLEWAAAEQASRPEAVAAVKDLNRAVQRGDLVRQPCEICGSSDAVHAHHAWGYAPEMALAVWWLCRPHHVAMHRAIRSV